MLGRLFKFLLGIFVLVLIVAIGGWVMVRTTENPMKVRIVGQSTGANGEAVIDYEVQNFTPFPVEMISSTFALQPPGKVTPAFVLPAGEPKVRKFTAGELVKGKLTGAEAPKPGTEFTAVYDWEPWGQTELRQAYQWMEDHADLVPESVRTWVFWSTETRKGHQASVVVPDPNAVVSGKKEPPTLTPAAAPPAAPAPTTPAAPAPAAPDGSSPSAAAAALNAASASATSGPAPEVVPPASAPPAPASPAPAAPGSPSTVPTPPAKQNP